MHKEDTYTKTKANRLRRRSRFVSRFSKQLLQGKCNKALDKLGE